MEIQPWANCAVWAGTPSCWKMKPDGRRDLRFSISLGNRVQHNVTLALSGTNYITILWVLWENIFSVTNFERNNGLWIIQRSELLKKDKHKLPFLDNLLLFIISFFPYCRFNCLLSSLSICLVFFVSKVIINKPSKKHSDRSPLCKDVLYLWPLTLIT